MSVAAIFVCQAKNSLIRRSGVSAHMHAFGREVRLPGDPDNPELHSRIDNHTDLQNIMEIKANAYRSCIDFEHDSHLRRAMLRIGRPWKGSWEVGMGSRIGSTTVTRKLPLGGRLAPVMLSV